MRSLAGYVMPQQSGSPIVFALILNGPGVSDQSAWGLVWYEELAPALASYPSTAAATDLAPP